MAFLALLVAIPISLLPEPWRERHRHLPLVAGTGAGGTLQLTGFLLAWMAGLYRYATGTWLFFQSASLEATGSKNASGAVVWFLYLLSPLSIVLLVGAAEGAARVAAFWTNEPCGSLLLWTAEKAVRRVRNRKPSRRGPPPRDELTRLGEGRVRIATSEPFERWHELMTVELEGAYFRVTSHARREGDPREYVYELEPVPAGWMMRGLEKYAPVRPPIEKRASSAS